ncbi:MAG: hypothetical protein NT118_12045 [Lentisphaerae bacterium]|nr:hypothetical protein [Lentisphaerota bacterium]
MHKSELPPFESMKEMAAVTATSLAKAAAGSAFTPQNTTASSMSF